VAAASLGPIWTSVHGTDQLIIADIDYMADRRRVVMVPVTLAETNPAYESDVNRYRITGNEMVSSPEFRFSGPTCLAATPMEGESGSNPLQRIYLSDEETIYVLLHWYEVGGTEVKKIVQAPGHQWSGLTVDLAGNLYMADYGTGRIYFMTRQELVEAEATGPAAAPRILRDVAVNKPGAMALDHSQSRLGVSTGDGIQLVTVPAILANEDVQAVRLRNFNKLVELGKHYIEGKAPYYVIPVNGYDFDRREVSVSALVHDTLLNQTCWRDFDIPLTPFAMTVLSGENMQQLLHGNQE